MQAKISKTLEAIIARTAFENLETRYYPLTQGFSHP